MGLRRAARRSAIPGADWRRAARLSRGAARFRAPVRTALRGYCAARWEFGRRFVPGCAVIARRGAIVGSHAEARNFGRSFAPCCVVTARLNAIPGAGSRRAARQPCSAARFRVRFLHIFLHICVPAHFSTFRIFAIFAKHTGIRRESTPE